MSSQSFDSSLNKQPDGNNHLGQFAGEPISLNQSSSSPRAAVKLKALERQFDTFCEEFSISGSYQKASELR